MAEDSLQRVRIWRFCGAPPEFQQLFPDAQGYDWIAHAAALENEIIGPSLLGWRSIHPVKTVTLADGSTVFWGAPSAAVASIAALGKPAAETSPTGAERRTAVRIRIDCPARYETHSEPKRMGEGHTIDISVSGIGFTSESLLALGASITIHIGWPIRLEGGIPVELRAVGRIVRADLTRAAMQVDETGFSFSSQEQSRSV